MNLQRLLEALLEHLSAHKIIGQRALHRDKKSQSELPAVEVSIENDFRELSKVLEKYGSDLQYTEVGLAKRKREHVQFKTVHDEWQSLQSKMPTLHASDSNELHTHLIGDIRTMITHIGDTSNLILDPDLDSYYLMDSTLSALPQMQDRLQEIVTVVEPIVRRQSATISENFKSQSFRLCCRKQT